MQADIHARIIGLFPALRCEGWAYKGFRVKLSEGVPMLRIRFEKPFHGKDGFCDLRISVRDFKAPDFDLRGWIAGELHRHDTALTDRRLRELAA